MSKITITALKKERDGMRTVDNGKRRVFTIPFKKKVVEFHYQEGLKMSVISKDLEIDPVTLSKWKKEYGTQKTAYTHGRGVRNDLRTKALAVREHIEGEVSYTDLAKKYNVGKSTIWTWVDQHRHDYKELINLPDRVPHLIKEEKMIYGDRNIDEIIELMSEQNGELLSILSYMQNEGFSKTSIKEAKEKQRQKQADLDTVEAAKKVIDDMKKGKK